MGVESPTAQSKRKVSLNSEASLTENNEQISKCCLRYFLILGPLYGCPVDLEMLYQGCHRFVVGMTEYIATALCCRHNAVNMHLNVALLHCCRHEASYCHKRPRYLVRWLCMLKWTPVPNSGQCTCTAHWLVVTYLAANLWSLVQSLQNRGRSIHPILMKHLSWSVS